MFECQLRQVPKDAETFLSAACPIVGSFGAKDRTLGGAADRLERALTAAGADRDVKQYPDAAEDKPPDNHTSGSPGR